jgi:hypothetical protein
MISRGVVNNMSETNLPELRQFERYALEFEVEVYTALDETRVLIERTLLQNVSGGGVCFMSKRPSLYSTGQKVFLHICMPGTDKMDAGMECMARVVWTHQLRSGEAEEQQAVIGICMDTALSFEKTTHDQGSGGNESGQKP